MLYIGVVLVFVVALLAIPFTVNFNVRRRQRFHTNIALSWLFGLVRIRFPNFSEEPPQKPLSRGKDGRFNRRTTANLFWNRKFRLQFFRFVKKLFSSIHIENLRFHLRLGLDDPADTGRLWGLVGPLSGVLSNVRNIDISLEPNFGEEAAHMDCSGKVVVVPLHLLFVIAMFLFSPTTISAASSAYRVGKNG